MKTRNIFKGAALAFAIAHSANADEIQRMTVAELSARCTAQNTETQALCLGLATGVLSQLQANGNFYMGGRMSEEARSILQLAGAACSPVEPKLALMAFINWSKIHPEKQRWNGLSGLASAIQEAWPCKEHL
ncbi:hypothetical protein IVA79_08095 [Bradyrhizobium sp. 138]|uniref:Rap1a/Tai family immunity protein n=1 Tax=Bradyrhizobium sp. 138 TaxID=2782615 RepID=UPI001FF89BAA|nr:Rap1a/Tai family immunity protein [Bradyrhizobium sp. 138]MCK1733916.1 hypothetical protein [Bradyrhizobium sp. 138]